VCVCACVSACVSVRARARVGGWRTVSMRMVWQRDVVRPVNKGRVLTVGPRQGGQEEGGG